MRYDKANIYIMIIWSLSLACILSLLIITYAFIVPGHLPGRGFESLWLIIEKLIYIYFPYLLSIFTAIFVIKREDFQMVVEKPFLYITFIIMGFFQFLMVCYIVLFIFSETNLEDFIENLTFFDNLSRNILLLIFTLFYLNPNIIERKK